jgi:hypothetical protein
VAQKTRFLTVAASESSQYEVEQLSSEQLPSEQQRAVEQ